MSNSRTDSRLREGTPPYVERALGLYEFIELQKELPHGFTRTETAVLVTIAALAYYLVGRGFELVYSLNPPDDALCLRPEAYGRVEVTMKPSVGPVEQSLSSSGDLLFRIALGRSRGADEFEIPLARPDLNHILACAHRGELDARGLLDDLREWLKHARRLPGGRQLPPTLNLSQLVRATTE